MILSIYIALMYRDNMSQVIYAVETHKLSYADLKITEVKIGRTSNINSTLAQYRRSHRNPNLLDLWYPNKEISVSKCEKGVLDLAEKYSHERSSETFRFLQDGYEQFSENVSHLLVQTSLEGLEESKKYKKERRKKQKNREVVDYTGDKPDFFVLEGDYVEVDNWKDILNKLIVKIYEDRENFDRIMEIKGRTRNYFSKNNPKNIREPAKVSGISYYYETNMSANKTMDVVNEVLEKFDYDESEFKLVLKSEKV